MYNSEGNYHCRKDFDIVQEAVTPNCENEKYMVQAEVGSLMDLVEDLMVPGIGLWVVYLEDTIHVHTSMAVHCVLCGLLDSHTRGDGVVGRRSGVTDNHCNANLGKELSGLYPNFSLRRVAAILCRRDVAAGCWTAIVMHGSERQAKPAARSDWDQSHSRN